MNCFSECPTDRATTWSHPSLIWNIRRRGQYVLKVENMGDRIANNKGTMSWSYCKLLPILSSALTIMSLLIIGEQWILIYLSSSASIHCIPCHFVHIGRSCLWIIFFVYPSIDFTRYYWAENWHGMVSSLPQIKSWYTGCYFFDIIKILDKH